MTALEHIARIRLSIAELKDALPGSMAAHKARTNFNDEMKLAVIEIVLTHIKEQDDDIRMLRTHIDVQHELISKAEHLLLKARGEQHE